ncbi:MAG: GspMb/PilO family protein [Coraliomargarita sp.]
MHNWLDSAKRIFKRMSVRERLLALVFILTIVGLWVSGQFQRTREWNDTRQLTAASLKNHQMYLDREEEFRLGLEAALERVEPSKTYSASQLSGRIDALIREAGLSTSANINPVRSRDGEIFNDHKIQVRLNRISIAQIMEFNSLIREETPYITVEKVVINANKGKPEQLNARFEINSFELKNLN